MIRNGNTSTRSILRRLGLFVAIGIAIYAALAAAAEQLASRTGYGNAFFRIETAAKRDFDWVILGASHAMPLGFGDFNAEMEKATGLGILNLAAPGAGPLYSRIALEQFLRRHRTRNVLYVVDAFSFQSRQWNEDRVADPKLLARTPLRASIAQSLWRAVRDDGVDPRAFLNYATNFAKLNNRERFERDVWEGEGQFERVARPSTTAVTKRIAYLFPDGMQEMAARRYLAELDRLISAAQDSGAKVSVVVMPVPQSFRERLPADAGFDAALESLLGRKGVTLRDFSSALPDLKFYFDTDHLNRAGVAEFFRRHLQEVLKTPA
jgi:hypothetical protein